MRVMMILKSDANTEAGAPPDQKMLTDMTNYMDRMMNAGVLLGGEGLHPTSHGARVRFEKGKTRVIDGPFAEAKEVVAGYFMIQTKSVAEALEWAQQIPGEPPNPEGEGEIEIRPLYETEDIPADPAEKAGGWREQELQQRAAPPAATPDKGPRWMAMLKANAHTEAGILPSGPVLQEMGDLMQDLTAKGLMLGGEGLKPSSHAKKLRVKRGVRTVLDGPFTEAKELIAGFLLYRAKDKAEAVEWARRWLDIHVRYAGIDTGEIEVRRVHETEDIPVAADEQAGGWRDRELSLRERLEK